MRPRPQSRLRERRGKIRRSRKIGRSPAFPPRKKERSGALQISTPLSIVRSLRKISLGSVGGAAVGASHIPPKYSSGGHSSLGITASSLARIAATSPPRLRTASSSSSLRVRRTLSPPNSYSASTPHIASAPPNVPSNVAFEGAFVPKHRIGLMSAFDPKRTLATTDVTLSALSKSSARTWAACKICIRQSALCICEFWGIRRHLAAGEEPSDGRP
jgi:hypothetical protein